MIPDADPQRPFQLVHTKVMTRRDTPLAVGDGIIAFATGRQGVAYLKVGEQQQRSIPDGQTYRGDLFYVCGKKIVLSNQYNLFVHDTVTGATMGIEDHDIHLRYRKHSLYGSRLVDADGYLVATVNDPSRVQDRAVIKILDVSDDEPQILSIRGSLPSADVTSVKVSAQHGYVAVSSKRRQAIYVASVADGAELQPYDVSGFDSVGEANMALLDRHVVYQDGAGFPSLRVLDLETGAVVTPAHGQHGGGWGTTVATNGRVTTWPTRDPRSTFVVTRDFDQVSLLSNSGDKVSTARNHGRWGEGQVAVVAHDGTVFLAGSQSISEQRCLQLGIDNQWMAVTHANGSPIPAIDVVAGNAMVAFKTGERSSSGPVSISYATFGERIRYSPGLASAPIASQDPSSVALTTSSQAGKPVAKSKAPRIDVAKEAYLATMLESEQQIYAALRPALGEAKARAQAIETALRALQANGHEDWIPDYKKRSSLFEE